MKIAILLYPGLTALDAIGPYEVFNQLPGVSITFVGSKVGAVRTDSRALALGVDETFADLPHPDVLVVPGGITGTLRATQDRMLINWVKQAHQRTQWTLSVCSGALILGAAGVLHGLTATTHWGVKDRLVRYGATYVAERYVRHGKIVTAAGVSAGLDMALFVAREMVGETQAQAAQLTIEYDPLPPLDAGSLAKATPQVQALAKQGLYKAAATELAHQLKDKVKGIFGLPDSWSASFPEEQEESSRER